MGRKAASITAAELDTFNSDDGLKANVAALLKLGGTDAVLEKLQTSKDAGLKSDEKDLAARAETYGANEFPSPESATFFELFVESFEDTTVQILLAAAVISLAVGLYEDPSKGWIEGAAIIIAVLVVAIVTSTNNFEKEEQFRKLNAVKDDVFVLVVRDDEVHKIKAKSLVVGDIVRLNAGDKIPADGIVLDAHDFSCNESSLTGEPEDVVKSVLKVKKGSSKVDDSVDPFVLSGTTVSSGYSLMLVTSVGVRSRWGKTKAMLATESEDTPLQEKLDTLAAQIGVGGLVVAVLTFAVLMVQWYWYPEHRDPEMNLLKFVIRAAIMAVTIVVVAVPEGLPLAVTISLAYSTQKMMADNNLIRVLAACETMGNATNICSDKTGTLTQNKMMVASAWVADKFYEQPPTAASLPDASVTDLSVGISVNSTAELSTADASAEVDSDRVGAYEVLGNKTEGALLMTVNDQLGLNYHLIRHTKFVSSRGDVMFPFNSDRKCMSTVILDDGSESSATDGSASPKSPKAKNVPCSVYTKGAPEVILPMCSTYTAADGTQKPLKSGSEAYKSIMKSLLAMSEKSLRTVALAHGNDIKSSEINEHSAENLEKNLNLDAVYGIRDPIRPDVPDAISVCQSAGIVVRMVTGDNIETARAIAKECGLLTPDGICMEGSQFRKMSPKELDKVLPKLQVLARSTPRDKYILVTRLNGQGLPTNQEEWEAEHPGCDWEKERDLLLPGYFDEWAVTRRGVGEVVGVTGDGTNDAPALKAADVGLSMGLTGTDVAKEASDIVILDDNFSSIVKAVLWGRSVFDNIRKFLQFQLTVNVVALTITLVSALTGYEPPLNAVMMLWVNLIMDTMGALALGTEPPSPTLLARKPYARDASIVSPVMWSHVAVQSLFQISVLGYMLVMGWEDFGVAEGSRKHNTIIFTIFVFCQVFNEFNARSIGSSLNVFAGLHKNIIFLAIIVFTCITQFVIVQFGADFVKVVPLTQHEWVRCILIASLTLPLGGLMRFTLIRESRSSFVETGTVVSKKPSKSVKAESAPLSFLLWFIVVTLIPVIVWSEFGQLWAPRFMVLAKRFA